MPIWNYTPCIRLSKALLSICALRKNKRLCHHKARDLELGSLNMGHDFDTIIKDINEDIILLLKVVNCDSHDRMGQVGSKRQELVCNTSASSLLLGV